MSIELVKKNESLSEKSEAAMMYKTTALTNNKRNADGLLQVSEVRICDSPSSSNGSPKPLHVSSFRSGR